MEKGGVFCRGDWLKTNSGTLDVKASTSSVSTSPRQQTCFGWW